MNSRFRFLIIVALFLTGCSVDTQQLPENCILVRYERGICGKAVLKIMEPPYYALGETVGNEANVFLATLECFTEEAPLQNTSFYVELNPADFNFNCAVCLAATAYKGSKQYNVRIHSSKCITSTE